MTTERSSEKGQGGFDDLSWRIADLIRLAGVSLHSWGGRVVLSSNRTRRFEASIRVLTGDMR